MGKYALVSTRVQLWLKYGYDNDEQPMNDILKTKVNFSMKQRVCKLEKEDVLHEKLIDIGFVFAPMKS